MSLFYRWSERLFALNSWLVSSVGKRKGEAVGEFRSLLCDFKYSKTTTDSISAEIQELESEDSSCLYTPSHVDVFGKSNVEVPMGTTHGDKFVNSVSLSHFACWARRYTNSRECASPAIKKTTERGDGLQFNLFPLAISVCWNQNHVNVKQSLNPRNSALQGTGDWATMFY